MAATMISFIVPAHNEQSLLGATLEAIHWSCRQLGVQYEIIVVDDASTDKTSRIALAQGARVVSVNHRQIAATRNSGGRAAQGEFLFFVDADTTCNPRAVACALRAMERGAVGGGAPTWVDSHEAVPLYAKVLGTVAVLLPKLAGFTGGAFMFCTPEAFRAVGGFNERLFWAEEGSFALALKREGKFVVLWQKVTTSGRRFRKVAGVQLLVGGLRSLLSPVKMFTRRSSVQDVWYDSDRTTDHEMPTGIATRVGNAITMFMVIVLLTAPLWNFVPWSVTPQGSPVGRFRTLLEAVLAHLGLLLWPIGVVLSVNLLRQKRWTSVGHSVLLIAFCFWQGWCSAQGVVAVWRWIVHRI
jgi:glycosyltransferase involved in cell wall biosynthesis